MIDPEIQIWDEWSESTTTAMDPIDMRKVYRYAFEPSDRLEPTPLYATLRSEEPVARVKLPYGEEGWLITRHESVKLVLSDARFSRAAVMAAGERTPRASSFAPLSNPLSAVDPPEQTRLRKLIAGAFTRYQAEQYRPRAHRIANELIDDMVAAGPPLDVIEAFAIRFPLMLIGEIFGVPASDRIQFRDWAIPVLSQRGYTREQIEDAYTRMRGYITALIARKREQPEDDLLTTFVRALVAERFTMQEVVSIAVALLVNDSVANQIGSCLYLLLTHPDQLAWLREDLSRVPQAVEELLRFAPLAPDTPAGGQGHIRMAMTDLTIDSVEIRAGEFVLPSITSANRDEQVFASPHLLDLRREKNPHIAFGHGPHRCPGEKVGRMEMQVAIATLLTRFPDLRLAVTVDEVPWKIGMVSRGPTKLIARW
jgi:cytochrome P450